MALSLLAEALARVEFKLDLILTRLAFLDKAPFPQLQNSGFQCPVCKDLVEHRIDITNGVVMRKCGCKTGILAPLSPLIPVSGTNQNGNPATNSSTNPDANIPTDSDRRKGR